MQLYDKFKNSRRYIDDPKVIINKKKKAVHKVGSMIATKLRWGGINWEPLFPEGEDDSALQKHMEFTQNEWTRKSPDHHKINKRMAITHPEQRRWMNGKVPLNDNREEYPALLDYNQVYLCFSVYLCLFN